MTKTIGLFLTITMLAFILESHDSTDAHRIKTEQQKGNARYSLLLQHKQFIAVTAKGDAVGMAELVADDYTVIGADGLKADKAQAIAAVRGNGVGIEMADSDVDVRFVGGAGIVTGLIKWKAGTGEQRVEGSVRYTEVWRKKGKGWELVAAQATNVQRK